MDYNEMALMLHEKNKGKIKVACKVMLQTRDDLSAVYTPGVAEPCRKIIEDKANVYKYTSKGNLVAVITDGTAVLGLGDIGPLAAMPVMEGKAILFKEFADIDAFPLCLDTKDAEEIIKVIKYLAPTFGGINLEDISAPRCFEIERRLRDELDIPVFHDDQHGTAIVVAAGIVNSLKLVKKDIKSISVVINGAGAAGISVARLLIKIGVSNIVLVDKNGALCEGEKWLNNVQNKIALITNRNKEHGQLSNVIKNKDVFIGVSSANALSVEMVKTMNKDAIVFAMANPIPEIMPEDAKKGGARIVATGRSDYPNQINNVLVFPGIFRGALDARVPDITDEMKIAAVWALANIIKDDEINEDYIIPDVFDKRVAKAVAAGVSEAAIIQFINQQLKKK